MRLQIKLLFLFSFILSFHQSFADTRRYRLSLRDDPSTSVVIGWEQNGGSGTTVYYGTTDFGQNWAAYPNTHIVDRQVTAKGMDNRFARLTGLTPNTAYYFVIRDSDGTSQRFWFKTTPMGHSLPLSVVAGGDSRAYLDSSPRQHANTLVSKLRPDLVLFGGDYTWLDLDLEWSEWMDDWQLTTSADGRMYPVIWERGNHETNAGTVYDLFDVPTADEYYAISVGGDFLRIYTLNTEVSVAGNQSSWLEGDLQANSINHDWNIAQYHKSMRPHTTDKSNEDGQYNAWAHLFHDYRVQLIVESDAHDVKTTWPISPSNGTNSDDGFELDTLRGSVYIGEGCWGAPLRSNDWNRSWTRNSASFNSFHWLKITRDTIEVRTVETDNANSVASVLDNDKFNPPSGLNIWNPSNGDVVYIINQKYIGRPQVDVTYPYHLQYFNQPQNISIDANAIDTNGTVSEVKFFVNDVQVGSDNTFPYSISFNIPNNGEYVIKAYAVDNQGWHNVSDNVKIFAGEIEITASLENNDDDAEQYKDDGSMDLTSSDLEMCVEEWTWPISDEDQWVGLRFNGLDIPQGATISNAYIQFTADEDQSDAADLIIYGEDLNNATAFTGLNFNLSARTHTSASVNWSVSAWTSESAGAAEQTPNISSIVQEIVNRPGWQQGNAMVFLLEGSGTRSAYSRDTDLAKSAKLHITFSFNSNSVPEETSDLEIGIFPNPVQDQFTIGSKTVLNGTISIYNMSGKLIAREPIIGNNKQLSARNFGLSRGMYFVNIESNQQIITKKIIVE